MSKFSNAKVGDRVYDVVHGWGTVDGFSRGGLQEFLKVKLDNGYTQLYLLNGKITEDDANPTLFWNEVKLPTEEEDKKPFYLVKYLEENLSPADFTKDVSNYYLCYDYCDDEWKRFVAIHKDILTAYFISICDTVLETLTNEKITPQQLKQAYKELGWL